MRQLVDSFQGTMLYLRKQMHNRLQIATMISRAVAFQENWISDMELSIFQVYDSPFETLYLTIDDLSAGYETKLFFENQSELMLN